MGGTDVRDALPQDHRPESRMWYGLFAEDVPSLSYKPKVILPDMDEHQTWGPCRWQKNGRVLPQKGDECLVAVDNLNHPWIVSWWSLDPQPPLDPVNLTPGANGQILETVGGLAGWHDLLVGLGNLTFDPATQAELDAHAALTTLAHGGIVAGTDARLTNARTPTAHKATHEPGGSDPLTLLDNTSLKAAAAIVASKLAGYPADVSKFLRGDGSWLAAIDTYTYTVIRSTGYGAAPDLNYRNFTNGTVVTDVHSGSSWFSSYTVANFLFPSAGTYLCAYGKKTPNAETGVVGMFLGDRTVGSIPADGALRGYTPAGSDPSTNLPRGGVSGGLFLYTPVVGHTYSFGGYYNGSTNFDIWFASIRLPL